MDIRRVFFTADAEPTNPLKFREAGGPQLVVRCASFGGGGLFSNAKLDLIEAGAKLALFVS